MSPIKLYNLSNYLRERSQLLSNIHLLQRQLVFLTTISTLYILFSKIRRICHLSCAIFQGQVNYIQASNFVIKTTTSPVVKETRRNTIEATSEKKQKHINQRQSKETNWVQTI